MPQNCILCRRVFSCSHQHSLSNSHPTTSLTSLRTVWRSPERSISSTGHSPHSSQRQCFPSSGPRPPAKRGNSLHMWQLEMCMHFMTLCPNRAIVFNPGNGS